MKYKIKDLSELMNVSSNTIRRYEKLGYLHPERDNSSNYRSYTNEDISTTMFVRFFRKIGFTHPDILKILTQETENSINLCKDYMEQMDAEILRLTKSRHLLKDYIKLMVTQPDYMDKVRLFESVPLYYTLFCSNSEMYHEPERLHIIQQYMYNAPETHMIYVFRKDDIMNDSLNFQCGWAIKPKDMPQFNLENSPYTEFYPKMQILVSTVVIPSSIEKYMESITNLRTSLLKHAFDYMKKHHYTLAGDVLGIRISLSTHNGQPVQSLLLNIPFAPESASKTDM